MSADERIPSRHPIARLPWRQIVLVIAGALAIAWGIGFIVGRIVVRFGLVR